MNKEDKLDRLASTLTLCFIYDSREKLNDSVMYLRENFKPKYKNNIFNKNNKNKVIDLLKDSDVEMIFDQALVRFNRGRYSFKIEKSIVKDELSKWIK
jgi:hypothetical protein